MKFFWISLLLGSGVWAADIPQYSVDSSNFLGKSKDRTFVAPTGHHFNDKAPHLVEVKMGTLWQPAMKLELKAEKITALFSDNLPPCQETRSTLYICDDKETYCVPQSRQFHCENNGVKTVEWRPNENLQQATVKSSSPDFFILNDGQKAMQLAKEKHKPLMIDFFGIWCPPCNQLDETVFSSPEFEKIQKNFVLLKMDADAPASWELKSKYKVKGYPTVVFASENGDELSRIVGSREKHVFLKEVKNILKSKDSSFEVNKKAADEKNSAKAAYKVGLVYLDREEYYPAHLYLLKASRNWTLGDIRRNKLMSASLGVQAHAVEPEDKKSYESLLLKALEWYPRQIEVFDRVDELAKVAEDLNDKETGKKAYEIEVSTAQWYLQHPKAAKNTDFSRGDLYETLGGAYEKLSKSGEAQAAFGKAAEEYLASIKKAGLDPNKERGYNLERVYCLWKSGQVDEAKKLYEQFESLYPTEFTFYYQHGRLLQDLKDLDRAEDKAKKALQYSYGDNKLRAAALLAEVYEGKKESKNAVDVLDKTMERFDLPTDQTIRTYRYYNKLVQMKKKLKGS